MLYPYLDLVLTSAFGGACIAWGCGRISKGNDIHAFFAKRRCSPLKPTSEDFEAHRKEFRNGGIASIIFGVAILFDTANGDAASLPGFIVIPMCIFLVFLMSTYLISRITLLLLSAMMMFAGFGEGENEYLWMGLFCICLCFIGAKVEKYREKK
jgi:hypothetical protein